ncbi:MAG: 8-amino-7-oxononanoate synthase [Betaproteobacteria bacterium]|nr:8-amino-7-oxononanoate synthase [Betaproteobacteria bacterium]
MQHSTFAAELHAELAALDERGLRRRRHILESPQGAHVVVDGREVVAFCSNDYLGLAADPRLAAAAREGAERYGVGAGASHLILGHATAHHALEAALARFVNLPRALLFSTGYMANLGIVTALAARGDAVFADKLNHASLNDAVLLSRADFKRYPHRDLAALEKLLAASKVRRRLVVTDAVFSMDGDIAPVPDLLRLCERYDAWLVLDDAHGFGVLGATGGGVLQHFGVASGRIVYMATLGKAAGVFGAFVAGENDLIEILVQRARPYIYTTAMPPLLANALLASLEIIAAESWRRERLTRLIHQLKQGMAGLRWRLMPSDTAIQPLRIGANDEALRVSAALAARGVLVPAIRPPTVPRGSARLRISLSAAHSEQDVAQLVGALRVVEKES